MTALEHGISRMNLDHLKTFHCIAVEGSFTRAAQTLFLTQPAVTLQIQGLENSLRVTLFDRSRRKIKLTPEGEALYAYTQRLFGLFDEIQHVFQDLSHLQAGRLVLAASAVMGTYYLTRLVSRFNKRFPRIAFALQIGNSRHVAEWVGNSEAELGFAGRSPAQGHLRQVFLHREPYTVVVAPGAPLAKLSQPVRIEEFLATSFVMREKGARTRTKIDIWLKTSAHGKYMAPSVTLSSLEATKRLVASGYGVTALPHLAVAEEIASEMLVPIRVENFDLNADYYLTYQVDKKFSTAALSFLSLLQEEGHPIMEDHGLARLSAASRGKKPS